MTRFLVLNLLALLAVTSAFTTPLRTLPTSTVAKPALFMFSADDKPQASGLSEVKEGETADALASVAVNDDDFKAPLEGERKMMTVKNRNTGKLMEVEMNESFLANDGLEMNWWAWVGFIAFPFTLLANDVFHFLPTEGPLGWFGTV